MEVIILWSVIRFWYDVHLVPPESPLFYGINFFGWNVVLVPFFIFSNLLISFKKNQILRSLLWIFLVFLSPFRFGYVACLVMTWKMKCLPKLKKYAMSFKTILNFIYIKQFRKLKLNNNKNSIQFSYKRKNPRNVFPLIQMTIIWIVELYDSYPNIREEEWYTSN